MKRLEIIYKANYMCYDSATNRVFISSKDQRILDTSGNQLGDVFHYGKNSSMRLSKDGKYLALLSPDRILTLLDTNTPEQPILSEKVGMHNDIHYEYNIHFINNKSFIFSIQNVLYQFQAEPQRALCPIFIGGQMLSPDLDWKDTGLISSLSCNERIIVALLYCFNSSLTRIVLISNDSEHNVIAVELPKEISNSYNQVCVMPNNGICLFSRYHEKPMLYYSSFQSDFSEPDLRIDLPPVHAPCFSADGRYLTFSVTDQEHPYGDCYLVNTSTWTVEEIIHDNMVYNPSFSNDGKRWLVPGNISYIYQL